LQLDVFHNKRDRCKRSAYQNPQFLIILFGDDFPAFSANLAKVDAAVAAFFDRVFKMNPGSE